MIHMDNFYVHGFLVFDSLDKDSARRKLIYQLIARLHVVKEANKDKCFVDEIRSIKSYLRTLTHPWRVTKRDKRPLIQYKEMTDECVETTYWLKDVLRNKEYCNLQP